MADNDQLLQTIEAVYASGLDSGRLPEALESTSRLLGAAGATFEVVDKQVKRHREFCSAGIPTVARTPYLEHFSALNPRMPYIIRQRAGYVAWDHQVLDEAGMGRDPFYSEFLADLGLRYFVGGVLEQRTDEITVVSVQRSRKQGHVDKREIALMQRLLPHFRRAHDMATCLRSVSGNRGLLEDAFDWLVDGVALLRTDGSIVYANDSLRELAQRGDQIRIVGRSIEFAAPEARRRFEAALGAVERLGDPSCDGRPTDFPVARNDGMPAYIVSVRPLVCGQIRAPRDADADVIVLIRDPLYRNGTTGQILQELFGLTNAEAHLAQALCAGMTTTDYAIERHLSLNTVYSHLKRIREKTGCKSLPELIRKFGELNVPLRCK